MEKTFRYDKDMNPLFKLPTRNKWIKFHGRFSHMTFPYTIETPVDDARFSFIFYTVNTIAESGVHSWRSEHLSNINEALNLRVRRIRDRCYHFKRIHDTH